MLRAMDAGFFAISSLQVHLGEREVGGLVIWIETYGGLQGVDRFSRPAPIAKYTMQLEPGGPKSVVDCQGATQQHFFFGRNG